MRKRFNIANATTIRLMTIVLAITVALAFGVCAFAEGGPVFNSDFDSPVRIQSVRTTGAGGVLASRSAFQKVLLIQNVVPWNVASNETFLNDMIGSDNYDLKYTSDIAGLDLSDYFLIIVANNQGLSSNDTLPYEQLAAQSTKLQQFVNDGGVLLFGAADTININNNPSWATYSGIPGGVTRVKQNSSTNSIADATHPIVTGANSGTAAITEAMLVGNYCSMAHFTSLPAGANVILEDPNGNPTLVEYSIGAGKVVASSLVWEPYANPAYRIPPEGLFGIAFDDYLLYGIAESAGLPTGIVLDPATATIGIGEELDIDVVLTPSTMLPLVTWTSSNDAVATVSPAGKVTGVANGTTTITAKTVNGLTATCVVTVAQMWTVTFEDWDNTLIDEVDVLDGEKIDPNDIPADPLRNGFIFLYWVDENDDEFDFDTLIDDDITLTAKYIVAEKYKVYVDGDTEEVVVEAFAYTDPINSLAILAIFEIDTGKMISVEQISIVVASGSNDKYEFTVDLDDYPDDEYSIEVYIWDAISYWPEIETVIIQ